MVLPGSSSATTKGNTGAGQRRRWMMRGVVVVIVVVAVLLTYHLLWTYWLAGWWVPDFEIDSTTGQKRYRRKPHLLVKKDPTTHRDVPTDSLDGILEGYLTLVDITLSRTALSGTDPHHYGNVTATFCHISWNLQQTNPAAVPMFRDLQDQSPLCPTTQTRVDLYTVARQAHAYDAHNHSFAATKPKKGHQVVFPPTMMVFHESRCGSTLVSNLLASTFPSQTRSYSEATPPLVAMQACNPENRRFVHNTPCNQLAQRSLLRDVLYLMGRVTREVRPQYVFYKISSVGVRNIDVFTQTLPQVPWMFVYRDSVEVLMSHLKKVYAAGEAADLLNVRPNCLRNYGVGRPQHPLVTQLAAAHGRNVSDLSWEEYCAVHLASLAQSALDEYQRYNSKNLTANRGGRRGRQWLVNYKELPYALWEEVWPHLPNIQRLHPADVDRMQAVAKVYSKARSNPGKNAWREDSSAKHNLAPQALRDAAQTYLDPVFQQLEAMRLGES